MLTGKILIRKCGCTGQSESTMFPFAGRYHFMWCQSCLNYCNMEHLQQLIVLLGKWKIYHFHCTNFLVHYSVFKTKLIKLPSQHLFFFKIKCKYSFFFFFFFFFFSKLHIYINNQTNIYTYTVFIGNTVNSQYLKVKLIPKLLISQSKFSGATKFTLGYQ